MRCIYLVWVFLLICTRLVLPASDVKTPDVAPHGPETPSLPAVHHLQAMDCRNPTHQRTTLLKDACAPPTTRRKEYVETKNVLLTQHVKSFQRKATRCRKYISTITEVCGKWGHSKLLFPPPHPRIEGDDREGMPAHHQLQAVQGREGPHTRSG